MTCTFPALRHIIMMCKCFNDDDVQCTTVRTTLHRAHRLIRESAGRTSLFFSPPSCRGSSNLLQERHFSDLTILGVLFRHLGNSISQGLLKALGISSIIRILGPLGHRSNCLKMTPSQIHTPPTKRHDRWSRLIKTWIAPRRSPAMSKTLRLVS